MTTLEQLVPPFELCRKIPKDAFGGTALVWWGSGNKCFVRDRHELGFIHPPIWCEVVPAPTAQEILEAMQLYFPNVFCGWRTNLERNGWCYTYTANIGATESCRNGTEFLRAGENLPEALLKLWLDVRRVEREAKNDQAVSDDSNNS